MKGKGINGIYHIYTAPLTLPAIIYILYMRDVKCDKNQKNDRIRLCEENGNVVSYNLIRN